MLTVGNEEMKQEFTWWHLMIACLFVRTFAIQNVPNASVNVARTFYCAAKKKEESTIISFFIRFCAVFFFLLSYNRLIYWTQCSETEFSFFFSLYRTSTSLIDLCTTRFLSFEMLLFSNCSFRLKTLTWFSYFIWFHMQISNFMPCFLFFCLGFSRVRK